MKIAVDLVSLFPLIINSHRLSIFQPKLRFKFPVFIERLVAFSLETNLGISPREQRFSGLIQPGSFCS